MSFLTMAVAAAALAAAGCGGEPEPPPITKENVEATQAEREKVVMKEYGQEAYNKGFPKKAEPPKK
jgi:hypothetical protein